jgi:ketosteroid isomerase-like protein
MRHRPIVACAFLLLFAQPQPAMAESLIVSQFGVAWTSSRPVAKTDTQFVYEVLLKMLDRWNAHDIDGLMSVYWNSPSLLAIIDTEQFDGWENLYRSYKTQYRNLTNMGTVNPTRVEVKLLKPDLAFGVISWTIQYPENAHASEIVGVSTMNIQKFDSSWKIVALHTSFTEM